MQVAPTHQHLHAKLCLQHLSGEIVSGHKPFQLQVEQNSSPEAERQKLREMHQLLVSFPRARVRGTATWHHFAEQCLVSCNFKEPKSFAFNWSSCNGNYNELYDFQLISFELWSTDAPMVRFVCPPPSSSRPGAARPLWQLWHRSTPSQSRRRRRFKSRCGSWGM